MLAATMHATASVSGQISLILTNVDELNTHLFTC
jgi:hypothetical protein